MARKVAIYIRQKGTREYELAHPRSLYPKGTIFVLRYRQRARRKWETLDAPDYKHAEILAKKKEIDLLVEHAGIQMAGGPPLAPKRVTKLTLADQNELFLEYKRTTAKKDGTPLDKETIDAYQQQVTEFLANCRHEYPSDVDGQDLRRYMAVLRDRGLSHRSVCNNYTSIATFLKFCDVDHKKLLTYSERPTPEDDTPEAYEELEMRLFYAALTRERDRLAFEVLLKVGLREREMTTLEWPDLNLSKNPTLTVQPRKPHLKFRTKTGKGRTIPLEKTLALKLADWKKKNPATRLVFGTKSDKEDSHFYRICVETAEEAGLNPKKFWLHKFRDTFGTWTCRAGKVDLRTLQSWMGHSSITMTERYLAPGQGTYAQTGINETFGAVNIEQELGVAVR